MSVYVHGDNILQKERNEKKYCDNESRKYLKEIRVKYDEWKKSNLKIIGPTKEHLNTDNEIIVKRVKLFNEYKDFIDQQQFAEKFDSRSNLHSSALEEFIYYLFKDLVFDYSKYALIGKSHTFKDIFFRSKNYVDMITYPNVFIEKKDHDFVIGTKIDATFKCKGMKYIDKIDFDIPSIAIECKTYLDKTMLEGSSTTAEQLKNRNPNAMYIIVAERLKLTESINLKKYKLDQIYILRKQKNTDREFRYLPEYISNPIFSDVVEHLFNTVRNYLETDWHGMIADGIERGYLIN